MEYITAPIVRSPLPILRLAIATGVIVGAAAGLGAQVGVTDGPKGVVVNPRNGKAYAAFPDLGVVKIVSGTTGPVVALKTGANVKDLTINPRDGRVYAMNRGPGTSRSSTATRMRSSTR